MKLFWGSPPGLAQGGTPWARIWGTPSETSVWLMVGAFYHGMDVAAQGCRVPPSVAQAVQVMAVYAMLVRAVWFLSLTLRINSIRYVPSGFMFLTRIYVSGLTNTIRIHIPH